MLTKCSLLVYAIETHASFCAVANGVVAKRNVKQNDNVALSIFVQRISREVYRDCGMVSSYLSLD
jgi:hypothetical protein